MKKFSKIFENKQFHNWNMNMVQSKIEEIPNSKVTAKNILYVYNHKDGSEITDKEDKYIHEDTLVQPLFIIEVEFNFNIKDAPFIAENDNQSDSCFEEILNWKIYSDWIQSISKVLVDFNDDFYVFINPGSSNLNPLDTPITIQFELCMKDKFDKEIMN